MHGQKASMTRKGVLECMRCPSAWDLLQGWRQLKRAVRLSAAGGLLEAAV